MNTALSILNAVWPYVAAGAAITLTTQVLKRLAKLEKSSVIRLLFHTVTVVVTVVTYLLGNQTFSAVVLLLHGTALSGIANFLYPLVSGADRKIQRLQAAMKLLNQELPAIEKAVQGVEQATQPPPEPAKF